MFDSLDDQMKHDSAQQTSSGQRLLVWAAVGLVTLVVFGGLYLGVQFLE
jgi:hypothetical protein